MKPIKITACAAAMLLAATGCGDKTSTSSSGDTTTSAASSNSKAKVGVILPDSKSSARWESQDRKYLEEAFKAAGVKYDIQNAGGDATKMATIADQMVTGGVNVLMIVNVDSESGATIEKKAADQGVKTIDYDRLTLGGNASTYISFNNVTVGKLQGEGITKCLADKGVAHPAIAVLNGSPTDNNATLFKQGYDGVIKPKFAANEWTLVDDQSVPEWDNQKGAQIFEQMYTKAAGKIDGVVAANDGLGNAAIGVLKKNNVKVPVTGQDATVEGLQNILSGDQCMTVYKAVKKEAEAGAAAAIALANGKTPETNDKVKDSTGNRDVPSMLLTPVAIYKDTVQSVIADNFVTVADLCTPAVKAACDAAGIK